MNNKQALREAAEKAGAEVWCAFIDTKSKTYAVHTPDDDRCGDVVKWPGLDGQQRAAAKARFIAAANPATVLALLDELEFLDKRNAELNSTLERWAVDRAQSASELDDAEKRIAELEAREVKLPELKMLSDYLREVTMREREDILLGVKLEFHRKLQAAGIITRIED